MPNLNLSVQIMDQFFIDSLGHYLESRYAFQDLGFDVESAMYFSYTDDEVNLYCHF